MRKRPRKTFREIIKENVQRGKERIYRRGNGNRGSEGRVIEKEFIQQGKNKEIVKVKIMIERLKTKKKIMERMKFEILIRERIHRRKKNNRRKCNINKENKN